MLFGYVVNIIWKLKTKIIMVEYIKVNVSKPWNGMLAIRDKYVGQAKFLKVGLHLTFKGGSMKIKFEDLGNYHSWTKPIYKDRFSPEYHALVYYKMPYEVYQVARGVVIKPRVDTGKGPIVQQDNPQLSLFN